MRSPAVLYSYHESTLELSHCFPDQWVTLWPCSAHLHFLCDCSHGGIVHVRAQSQNGRYEMFTRLAVWCLSLVFPTETHQGFLPEQVMEVLLLQGGGGLSAAEASDGFPPQLLFEQHSPSHSAASLCKLFESRVCLYAHLLFEGAARWQILAWKLLTLMSQYLF